MTSIELGSSVEGRPLVAVRVGDAAPGGLVVFGGIHGDEPQSVELCQRFLQRSISRRQSLWVLPATNPDGLFRRCKDNAHGVDLNRNFAAKNFSIDHPPGYDPGPAPASEPETRALIDLLDCAQPSLVVSVHQPFRCINWDGPAADLAAAMATASGYPAVASLGYPTPGSFGSWWGVDLGRPVITLEMPRTVDDSDWDACLRALDCTGS